MKVPAVFSLTVFLLQALAAATVIEATDKDLSTYLSSGIPTILDIYASWCGHCKNLAPVLDSLSEKIASQQDKVQIVKIDGDKYSKAVKDFNVEYFPLVKYIGPGSTDVKSAAASAEDVEARSVDGLISFIKEKVPAVKVPVEKPKPNHVIELHDTDFDKIVSQYKGALVAFTASWCGHCKTLKPNYAVVGDVLSLDGENGSGNKDVLVGMVDCTGEATKHLAERFKVSGYPTILYFPVSEAAEGATLDEIAEPYSYGRSAQDFLDFLSDKGLAFRNADGTLNDKAGVIAELSEMVGAGDIQKAIASATEKGNSLYQKVLTKISNDAAYMGKEIARVEKLLHDKAKISAKTRDTLTQKLNVLKSFKTSPEHKDL